MNDIKKTQQKKYESAFVNLRPMLGNFNWATFLFLIGGAQAGKSYAMVDFFVSQFMENDTPFYWKLQGFYFAEFDEGHCFLDVILIK